MPRYDSCYDGRMEMFPTMSSDTYKVFCDEERVLTIHDCRQLVTIR